MCVPNENQVPLPALERLSTYIRCLMQLEHEGVVSVSSQDMERFSGVSAAQFRKDLSYFGEFGKRGIGYNVRDLRGRIAQLLYVDKEQNVVLVGAGNLGAALIAYPGWHSSHYRIAAVFDRDPAKEPAKVGTSIRRVPVHHIDTLEEANREIHARIGIVAVPAWEAQEVADRLVASGFDALINFAPIKLSVPKHVIIREVCFICELAVLSHLIHNASDRDAEPGNLEAPDPASGASNGAAPSRPVTTATLGGE
jgi:redox-sensing transcriptional repressor